MSQCVGRHQREEMDCMIEGTALMVHVSAVEWLLGILICVRFFFDIHPPLRSIQFS